MALTKNKTAKSKPVKAKATATKPSTPSKPAVDLPEGTYEGYCVKCKEKGVQYKGVVEVSKTGMNIAKGPCPSCGTTICRIMGKAKAA